MRLTDINSYFTEAITYGGSPNNNIKNAWCINRETKLKFADHNKEFNCNINYLPKELKKEFENWLTKTEEFINNKLKGDTTT